jgi:hypothetical protein
MPEHLDHRLSRATEAVASRIGDNSLARSSVPCGNCYSKCTATRKAKQFVRRFAAPGS